MTIFFTCEEPNNKIHAPRDASQSLNATIALHKGRVTVRGVSFTDTTARTAPHLTAPKPILIVAGAGACNKKTAL